MDLKIILEEHLDKFLVPGKFYFFGKEEEASFLYEFLSKESDGYRFSIQKHDIYPRDWCWSAAALAAGGIGEASDLKVSGEVVKNKLLICIDGFIESERDYIKFTENDLSITDERRNGRLESARSSLKNFNHLKENINGY